MTYELAGTKNRKPDGQITSLVFRNAAKDEITVTPVDFYLGNYDQQLIAYKAQTDGAVALVHKGPYPSDIPALNKY